MTMRWKGTEWPMTWRVGITLALALAADWFFVGTRPGPVVTILVVGVVIMSLLDEGFKKLRDRLDEISAAIRSHGELGDKQEEP